MNYFKKIINRFLEANGYTIKRLNKRAITEEDNLYFINHNKKLYTSYIPDKYSSNISIYKNTFYPFFDDNDVNKWVKGNFENNSGDLPRFYFLNLVIDQLLSENISGDVAELGVYKGNSAFLLAKFARAVNKKAYLFDTYEGFNKKDFTGSDGTLNHDQFSDTSVEYVKDFVGADNTVFIKGYFPESLKTVDLDNVNFSLVHIDCDLEKPFISALNYFYPKLMKGGFLILHDYSSLHWPAARKAIENFFSNKSEKLIPIPDKSGTVVVRKL